MGHGTKVGQGEAEVITKKDLLVRLQAPRFFVAEGRSRPVGQRPQLPQDRQEGRRRRSSWTAARSTSLGRAARRRSTIPAGGEKRVDWRVKVTGEGEAVVRMKAVTDEESDAMEMRFPCYVHGMLKTDSFAGVIRPDKDIGQRRASACRPSGAINEIAAGSPLLADAGRGDGRRPAVPGRLSLRLHRADAQPLPADRHHAADPAST